MTAQAECIRSQPGPQTDFLAEWADIAGYGGARGGGKSAAAIFHPMPFLDNARYSCVIFRRTEPEILQAGGLWEKAWEFFPLLGGVPNREDLCWTFPSGATVGFGHFADDRARSRWQGAGINHVILDEATHFEERWFWMLLSSNRSTSGVKSVIRLTFNPDPESWLRRFFAPWIAPDGLADLAQAGQIQWFINLDGDLVWRRTRRELLREYPGCAPQSAVYHIATVFHNAVLLMQDPSYLAKLRNLPALDRARFLGDALRGGSWLARPEAGTYFRAEYFPLVAGGAPPGARRVRSWDIAWQAAQKGTDPDWTVGTLIAEHSGRFYIEDVIRLRGVPAQSERAVKLVAARDNLGGQRVTIRLPGDAGLGGVTQARWARELAGYDVRIQRDVGDKVERSKPYQAQCELRNVMLCQTHTTGDIARLLAQPWTLEDGSIVPAAEVSSVNGWQERFLQEHCEFPRRGVTGRILGKKDSVDSAVGGFLYLVGQEEGPSGDQIARDLAAAQELSAALGSGWGLHEGGWSPDRI